MLVVWLFVCLPWEFCICRYVEGSFKMKSLYAEVFNGCMDENLTVTVVLFYFFFLKGLEGDVENFFCNQSTNERKKSPKKILSAGRRCRL